MLNILINCFICKLDIFPLMCAADKIWITELTLIHKNIRSVRNSHAIVYWSILRKAHYEITDKTITSVLKTSTNIITDINRHHHRYQQTSSQISTDIITDIPARPIGLVVILAIISVSIFKIAVILHASIIFCNICLSNCCLLLLHNINPTRHVGLLQSGPNRHLIGY